MDTRAHQASAAVARTAANGICDLIASVVLATTDEQIRGVGEPRNDRTNTRGKRSRNTDTQKAPGRRLGRRPERLFDRETAGVSLLRDGRAGTDERQARSH